ncbi:hypothetical protein GCM10007860_29470 [Chitiniphilus shinanonensis]|uniref:Uncharacterized protein n=1 Tax=Chitiniphilus shinanonensis TaxID=553088 RepID=A0ABQ6BUW7_9NEIS|nr:hypothetical protein GCM10007860_29470 [Chitiniphilus shinanonensis]
MDGLALRHLAEREAGVGGHFAQEPELGTGKAGLLVHAAVLALHGGDDDAEVLDDGEGAAFGCDGGIGGWLEVHGRAAPIKKNAALGRAQGVAQIQAPAARERKCRVILAMRVYLRKSMGVVAVACAPQYKPGKKRPALWAGRMYCRDLDRDYSALWRS